MSVHRAVGLRYVSQAEGAFLLWVRANILVFIWWHFHPLCASYWCTWMSAIFYSIPLPLSYAHQKEATSLENLAVSNDDVASISPSKKVTHHSSSQNLILWSSLHKSSSISELCRIWFNASTFWWPVWVWNIRFSTTRFFSVAKLDGTILALQDCVCVKI